MMVNRQQATELLDRVASAWRAGNPDAAVECFTEDALYLEPPDRQVYVGRQQLRSFFHGNEPMPQRLSMRWHGIGWDESTQTAYAEYTFQRRQQRHGVAVVSFRDGLIASWREYQYASDLPWDHFIAGGGAAQAGHVDR